MAFFHAIPTRFQDVLTVDAKGSIDTRTFLEAIDGFIEMLKIGLPGIAFSQFKDQMTNYRDVIRGEYQDFPEEAVTLQSLSDLHLVSVHSTDKDRSLELVAHEGNPGESSENRAATLSLLWITRGLHFVALGLRQTLTEGASANLATCFKKAYDGSLKPHHHGILVRPIVTGVLKMTPSRKEFFSRLGAIEDEVEAELDPYVASMEGFVQTLNRFFERGDWARGLSSRPK